jgi:3-oxoacyl-[acyl-carrier-protein] synthase-3
MSATSVGILGVGLYLPPEIRRNDWWPPEVVDGWKARPPRQPPALEGLSEGARRVVEAMSKQALDPFQGAVERHVMGAGMSVFDMEEQAARAAIARAGVDMSDIDLVLTHTLVPDFLLGNPACTLHHRLGLSKTCFSLETDAATYAFIMQLEIADAMIKTGKARTALLVQSSGTSPLVDYADPTSVVFGDGASAVVVGEVAPGRGIRGAIHFTDGRVDKPLVAGVPGGRWFDEGRAKLYLDHAQMGAVLLSIADVIKDSVNGALAKTGLSTGDVDFFCMHQGTPWLRRVVEEYTGLANAKSVETFAKTGYLFGSILPAGLHFALEDGLLQDGDTVMLAAGGTGMTNGAMVMEWGR